MGPAAGGGYKGYNAQARQAGQGTNQSYSAGQPLDTLSTASVQDQKQMLGERIFPIVQSTYPDEAGKITGMLLEMDNSELLMMLEDTALMVGKMSEAMSVLRSNKQVAGDK
jgi:polyadenylate-binding protein